MKKKLHNQSGFTLVELMVVVTIIAILASVGLPKMAAFVRTSETSEAVEISARIIKSMNGYIESHPEITDVTTLADNLNNHNMLNNGSANASSQITAIIPHMVLATNSNFSYKVAAKVDGSRVLWACVTATRDGGTGTNLSITGYKPIYISSVTTLIPGWEGNVYRRGYLDGTSALVVGGTCGTDGAATSTPI
ncbi:MAG: type II secretion system protein [Magnetococcales bacterium]|nr:type II secretion system protein [Magnetococcales bacterium]